MIDLAAFRAQCPEFNGVGDARVQSALDQAEARTDADVFGDLTDEAHKYLTCHILASSPSGREAAVKGMPGETTYSLARTSIERIVGSGYGVLPDG